MKKARRRAKKLGFDPNRWFGNVEIGMYRAVSGEPASYVRNIYKYYVTYQSKANQNKTLKSIMRRPLNSEYRILSWLARMIPNLLSECPFLADGLTRILHEGGNDLRYL